MQLNEIAEAALMKSRGFARVGVEELILSVWCLQSGEVSGQLGGTEVEAALPCSGVANGRDRSGSSELTSVSWCCD